MSNGWACAIRLGGIGDDLICSSVFPGLRAKYGRLEVITRPPAGVVFENNPHIDKLTMWPEKDEPPDPGFWRLMLRKRMAEYDFGIHLSGTCEGRLAFTEGQAEFGWPDKARRSLAEHSYLGFVHDLCDLPHDFAPSFYPTEAETTKARATLDALRARRNGPMVGWCLSGSRIDKIYPGTIPVIIELLKLGANVCMFGKPDKEYAMACDVQKQVQLQLGSIEGLHLMLTAQADLAPGTVVAKKIADVAGTGDVPFSWPIRRTLATLQLCDVVVGPDTGAMWSVAMRSMPKVVLLSHASPLNITTGWINTTTLAADSKRVPCWPCHQLHDRWDTCYKHPELDAASCIADIKIAGVVDAVCEGIGRKMCMIDGGVA
jgi:ADP-heptose:LPS heptosyltransferase